MATSIINASGGGDYTSIQSWANDIESSSEHEIAEIQGTTSVGNLEVWSWGGERTVRANSGNEAKARNQGANIGYVILSGSSTDKWTFENVRFTNSTSTPFGNCAIYSESTTYSIDVIECWSGQTNFLGVNSPDSFTTIDIKLVSSVWAGAVFVFSFSTVPTDCFVYRCAGANLAVFGLTLCDVKNCFFGTMSVSASTIDVDYTATEDDNADDWGGTGNLINIDPDLCFSNWSIFNAEPIADSPLIDSGVDLTSEGITEDPDGTSIPQGDEPDIGPFEYLEIEVTEITPSGGFTFGGTGLYGLSGGLLSGGLTFGGFTDYKIPGYLQIDNESQSISGTGDIVFRSGPFQNVKINGMTWPNSAPPSEILYTDGNGGLYWDSAEVQDFWPQSLSEMGGVSIIDETNNDIIAYQSETWVNQSISGVGGVTTSTLQSHTNNSNNPHSVTAEQVGVLTSIDGVSFPGGHIVLIAGTGISISSNAPARTVTVSTVGTVSGFDDLNDVTISNLDGSGFGGPLNPGTVINESSGTAGAVAVWGTPQNAMASNNTYASALFNATSGTTEYLWFDNYGFTIPDGSTILGIEAMIERRSSRLSGTGTISDYTISLVKAGNKEDANKALGTAWSLVSDQTITYGSSVDLWDSSWTSDDINHPDFGVALRAQTTNNNGFLVASVDVARIRIYYQAPELNFVLVSESNQWVNKTLQELDVSTNSDLQDHISNISNPHSVTASQVGVITSVNDISNSGGNIDIVAGTGINITPDDGTDSITIEAIGISVISEINVFDDVTITDVTDGEVIIYVTDEWVNQTLAEADIASDTDLQDHISNISNIHSVTASQVGALASVNSISNAGGNIDLVAGAGITITPNDGSNEITITQSLDVVQDLNPQLGGNLDTNGFKITTTNNKPLILKPDSEGSIQSNELPNTRGINAVDWVITSTSTKSLAVGDYSTIIGGVTITEDSSNDGAVAINTTGSDIVGDYNVAVAGNVDITGNYNAILGTSPSVSGSNSVLLPLGVDGGRGISENYNVSLQNRSVRYGELSGLAYQGDIGLGIFSEFVLRNITTDDSETELFLDGASKRLLVTIGSKATWTFNALISARGISGTDADKSAVYRIEGVLKHISDVTSIAGTVTKTVLAEETAGWDANIEADDTNDALVVKVVGSASNTIYWTSSISICALYDTA